MTIQRNPARLFATLGILSLCLALLFGVVLPPLNGHAIERHDDGAFRAHQHVSENGGDWCRWECKDGRVRYICPINGKGPNLFAVVVLAGDELTEYRLVTAFICRADYALSLKETGKNPWRFLHP